MSTASEPIDQGNAALHQNGDGKGVAVEPTDTQIYRGKVDFDELVDIGRRLLVAIGEDTTREGLVDTPTRFAKAWQEFVEYDSGSIDTSFSGSYTSDHLIAVTGIRVWSMCEHHLLPFWADVSIGYIPDGGKVLGLSKFARIAQKYAHSLQVQEQLAHQIAEEIKQVTGCQSVITSITGEHTCMLMRGIKSNGKMITQVVSGSFKDNHSLLSRFASICNA